MLTGCRLSEIQKLRWEHVDLQAGELNLPDTKTGRRWHDLPTAAQAILATLPRSCAWTFSTDGKTKPTYKTVRGCFAREAAEAGDTTQQAKALAAGCIATIRGNLNGLLGTDPLATRDMAMPTVMADAGLRRSEASALRWCDITIEDDGSGRVTIRLSKTDQEGEGAVVAITAVAVKDLLRLRELQPGEDGDRPFPVGPVQISNRIAAVTRAAGLGKGYSGHSPRVGMAQRMTKNGAPAAATMRQGRWASADMVARYTRALAAGEALRYL
jgi:integrase